jgi:predicted  nucleic acid-binding Zn-ribbon protein
MIKELIVKLLEEANADADNKGWCDDELRVNGVTRTHKTTDVEELTAEVEKLTADVSKLTQDIGELNKETTAMRKAQRKATELYNEEKATNHETISEAKAAQVAVERASQVLKEMYGMSSKSSLLQSEDSDSMNEDMEEATSAGQSNRPFTGSGKTKVLKLMEVILNDFAKLEASTSSKQDESAEAYKKFMVDTKTAIEVKEVEISHMEKKKQRTGDNIRSLKKELKATQKELDSAVDYYMKLRPDCVATGQSYKDRVQLRQGEIQSLQEAIGALSPAPQKTLAFAPAAAPAAAPAPSPAAVL